PQVDEIEFPDGKRIIVLSEGRLVNLGNATGHPSFVMSASFSNQTLAQVEIWTNPGKYEKKVYTLPKVLDEKVAALHLEKVGAKLTKLRPDQAKYIGVPEAGPLQGDLYRYSPPTGARMLKVGIERCRLFLSPFPTKPRPSGWARRSRRACVRAMWWRWRAARAPGRPGATLHSLRAR